jgi:hypothetical protein
VPLVDVNLSVDEGVPPRQVVAFLTEADARIREYFRTSPCPAGGFIPSDYVAVYHALRAIADSKLACGDSFCEWGSGFGVVASLAAMLDFGACGIEIERRLVVASRRLAKDFALSVEFVQGSFIPAGGEVFADEAYAEAVNEFFWLVTEADDAYDELGRNADDLDLVYAYPWPDEEAVIERLFEHFSAEGSLLLTQHEYRSLRLQRKVP